jgi:2-dehydropantoate 2-reductase
MKVCVFGAGAVGGHLAVQMLAADPAGISIVARGAMLRAVRERGLTLQKAGNETTVRPALVTDDPSSLPQQDLVLVTLKAHSVPGAAAAIARLLAPDGCAVFLLNGIPWWWRHGLTGPSGTLPLLDPDSALWREVKPERALGGVVHSPNEIIAPGVIKHSGPDHLILGEPDNSASARLETAVAFLKTRGVDARLSRDLRGDILQKLVFNASGNPISALARADLGVQGSDPELRALCIALMRETMAVSAALGWDLSKVLDVEAAARRGKPGDRPSMMQDAILGRRLETEAVLGQVQAFAREKSIPVPTIDVILPLLRALDRALGAQ